MLHGFFDDVFFRIFNGLRQIEIDGSSGAGQIARRFQAHDDIIGCDDGRTSDVTARSMILLSSRTLPG